MCLQVKWSSLHLAAGNGHFVVVERLILSNVDVNVSDKVNTVHIHTIY